MLIEHAKQNGEEMLPLVHSERAHIFIGTYTAANTTCGNKTVLSNLAKYGANAEYKSHFLTPSRTLYTQFSLNEAESNI